ncbi:hypothetical protein PALU110988_23770 [Paenibacillus lupini]|uniref:hypothetical protein n=1 Tax=Paenibacillus lupini TaxID=1450204 RepID=UPI00141FB4F9|nr:hypothetical protein [Paenibacillus lupini]NIK23011.1 hypothetical protein [Paenibacillus lupini]
MQTIAYYISDYGYGHATRSIAVIRTLLRQASSSYRIIVCSSDNVLSFLRTSLHEHHGVIVYRSCISDVGYVLKVGTIEPDLPAFRTKYNEYMMALSLEVAREVDFLRTNEVDLVISDISPIAFVAANKAEVTSVGLSNFTWYTAYQEMIERSALLPLYKAYSMMDYFICLEGADEPEWGRRGSLQVGFFSREIDQREVIRIQQTINPGNRKRIVYFGIGMSINVQDLAEMKLWKNKDYLFIVSSNMKVTHENVISIPASYTESQNYVAASDFVISKPGWSTVGEAVVLQKPLILLHRSSMREDENTIRVLQSIHPYQMAEWEQLIGGNMQDLINREYSFADKQLRNEITQIVAYLNQIVRSG